MNDRERLAHIEQAARNMEGEASMIARLAAELRGRVEEQADSPIAPDVPSARPGEGLGTEGSNPSPASPVKLYERMCSNPYHAEASHPETSDCLPYYRRTHAPSPATGESAIEGILDDEACRARSVSLDVVRVKLMQRVEAARAELASLRASAESAPMPTREREEILKNDEIALAIADGMARCADVFCDQAQPDRRREAARMTHKRLADSRELLAAVHADVVRLRSALAEKEKAGVDVRAICLHVVNDLERQHGEGIETLDLPTRDRVWHSVRRALHAALGAKETK